MVITRTRFKLAFIAFLFFFAAAQLSGVFVKNMGFVTLLQGYMTAQEALLGRAVLLFDYADEAPGSLTGLSYAHYHLREYSQAEHYVALARERGERPVYLNLPDSNQRLIMEAVAAASEEDWAAALSFYRQAFIVAPGEWPVELYRLYYESLSQTGQEMPFIEQMLAGGEYNFDPAAADLTLTPSLPLLDERDPAGCWQLRAIAYDREALEVGPLVPAVLTWGAADGTTLDEGRLLQNYAPNAGFEWPPLSDEITGYPVTIYFEDIPEETRSLHLENGPSGGDTHVLRLQNTNDTIQSSAASNRFSIQPDVDYFQAVWLKNQGGHPRFGHSRFGLELPDDQIHAFFPDWPAENSWDYLGEIVTVPAAAESAHLTLLNARSDGPVSYDEMLFFRPEMPPCQ